MTYKFKTARMRSRYYLQEVSKRFFGWLPFVLFLVSFGLFATVFFPAIGHRLAHRLSTQPERFILTGRVSIVTNDTSDTPAEPANEVRIEIGGFFAATDPAGAYRLQFWSPQRHRVTVVLRFRDTITIRTLRLPSTGHEWTRNWVLEDK